ncbi:MAG: hypothetical protein JKY11_05975 [Alphaproteobacteria bacterium]|nr:hypothetical protein [Alphaproteobacteria bacterium]
MFSHSVCIKATTYKKVTDSMGIKRTLKAILILGVLGAGGFVPYDAHAQSSRPECQMNPEKVIKLGMPVFGGYLKWKRSIAQPEDALGQDRLIRVFDNIDNFVVIGEHKSADTNATFIQVIQMDYNGLVLGSVQKDLKTFGRIIDVINHDDKIIVLLEKMAGDGVRHTEIKVFSEKGEAIRSKILKTDTHVIMPSAITVGTDGALYVATQHKHKKQFRDVYSVLYKLNDKMKVMWKRSFLPSTPTRIHALITRADGGFLAAGEIAVPGGRKRQRIGGWLMALSEQGGMEWQRSYPRGYNSRLNFIHETKNKFIFTAGTAYPSGDGNASAWIMTNNANSNPVWQRYFSGKYAYKSIGLQVSDDEQTTLVLQGTPVKNAGANHVRLLSLSQLGYVMNDRSYIEGAGVEGHGIVSFKNPTLGRYIIGSAEMPSTEDNNHILDGWIASIHKARKNNLCR